MLWTIACLWMLSADAAGTIDAHLQAAQVSAGITPAPIVDDAGFLRRVHLDLTGTLPTPERVRQFLADQRADKRTAVVDELLARSAYARHWADYWSAVLMGRLTREAFIDTPGFRQWLQQQFADNVPWNQIVHALIAAEGYNTNKRPKGATSDPKGIETNTDPATNWFLRHFRALPEVSGATARIFLGVQIQCAQCHDHKTEKWTQKDFRQFTAFFAKTYPTYYDKALVIGTHRLETKDRLLVPPTTGKFEEYFSSYKEYTPETPKFLQGAEYKSFTGRRRALADWVTAKTNPTFGPALVNRYWARLTGRGFVEPIDDIRPGNPPTCPEALQCLADDFVAHDFDLRHLLRTICQTQAYQRACQSTDIKAGQHPLWASAPIRPLDVETFFDIVLQGTGSQEVLEKLAKGNLPLVRSSFVRLFVQQLATDDQAEVSDADDTIPRMLMQFNGSLFNGLIRNFRGSGLDRILKQHSGDNERIEALYLTALGRLPTAAELTHWRRVVQQPRQVVQTKGPDADLPKGLAGLGMSREIADADKNDDLRHLVEQAKTAADFKMLARRIQNNADVAIYATAFEAWAAAIPFQTLAQTPGGDTPTEQAYEDLFWALINSTAFLTNH